MVLHLRCLREMLEVLEEYIEKDKLEEFMQKILKVRGTISSFKIVFNEVIEYMKRKSDSNK